MFDGADQFINECFTENHIGPEALDLLLADGWRHFGTYFFRYSICPIESDFRRVVPLRIRLADFSFTKSQRRTLRRNADLKTSIDELNIDLDAELLFHRHKQRFYHSVPNSIFDFVTPDPSCPAVTLQLRVLDGTNLLAASYFDLGARSLSGIYAMFEPRQAQRGLGIFTLLKEIEYAISIGKEFYYLGYCFDGPSFYDYKKRFRATEAFDWAGEWNPFRE